MKLNRVLLGLALLAVFAAARFAPAGVPESTRTSGEEQARAVCVFTNQAFSGKCTQNTDVAKGMTPRQACAEILSCLNDSRCLKTYCNATQIRGGWQLESAKLEGAGSQN